MAALRAGEHILCEKPPANDAGEAADLAAVAREAARRGVPAMCGFTNRRPPAADASRWHAV